MAKRRLVTMNAWRVRMARVASKGRAACERRETRALQPVARGLRSYSGQCVTTAQQHRRLVEVTRAGAAARVMMAPMRIAYWLPLLVVACSTPRYFVPDRSLDAWTALPRAERANAVVPAERGAGGPTVYIHGSDTKPLREMRGDKRRVKTARAATYVAITLLIEGGTLLLSGLPIAIAAATGPQQTCTMSMGDACGGGSAFAAILGGTLAGMGGVELIVGGILLNSGTRSFEVPRGQPGVVYLP
jgi:hypothetical protein